MAVETWILDGVRTPQGVFGGALKTLTAQALGETALRELLARTRLKPGDLEEVIIGCVGQQSDAARSDCAEQPVVESRQLLPLAIPLLQVS